MRLLRHAINYPLARRGFVLNGKGGLSHLDSYVIERYDVPVPTVPSAFGPTTFEVDLHRITTPCAFSYHPEGWHPYRATLAEVLAEPDLPYERTTLARYYDAFQPRTVQEAILEDAPEPLPPLSNWPLLRPLYVRPWALTVRRLHRILNNPHEWQGVPQQFGPHPVDIGRMQIERLVHSYESLARGYAPEAHAGGFLNGYFLVRGDDYRFVVLHGNHRLAAFELLGIDRPLAVTHANHPPVVHADRLERWVDGRYGVFPRRVAEQVFDKLFDETGRAKAERLGLL
jgi:hypothetical protein